MWQWDFGAREKHIKRPGHSTDGVYANYVVDYETRFQSKYKCQKKYVSVQNLELPKTGYNIGLYKIKTYKRIESQSMRWSTKHWGEEIADFWRVGIVDPLLQEGLGTVSWA
jgi:hypothetical protein